VTAGEAFEGEPGAFDEAEAVEGDVGVLRTGGEIEALGGADGVGEGREDALVEEEGEAEGEGLGHGVADVRVPQVSGRMVGMRSHR
jgi:hypothetical protein